jgi:hypothetical protein
MALIPGDLLLDLRAIILAYPAPSLATIGIISRRWCESATPCWPPSCLSAIFCQKPERSGAIR